VSHPKDKDKYRTGAKMGSGVFWSVQKLPFFEEDAEMVELIRKQNTYLIKISYVFNGIIVLN